MAQNNVDKALVEAPIQYDITNLTPEQAAQVNANDDIAELDIQLVGSDDDNLDADGGATINLGPEAPVGADTGFYANLADSLTEAELSEIATYVATSAEADKSSRQDWEDTYTKGLDLLGIKPENRTEPFEGATGVSHPVLNESVSQFQAGAYKELIPPNGPVSTKVIGKSTPELEKRAQRIKDFMNYNIMYVMEEYEPEYDQMLYFCGLSGSAFKKIYRDDQLGRPVSKFIPAEDLLVPYTATSLRSAERITHVIRISGNELRKLQVSGFYRDIELPNNPTITANQVKEKYNELEGKEATFDISKGEGDYTLYECHGYFDLESYPDLNADSLPTGIKLPYIVTICADNNEVLGVRRNWNESDQRKRRLEHFVHYKFTPGLGFYGFGLIHLLGNLSKSATSVLRQLIDAGTLSNLPGGFKARGLRIANDQDSINPGEWRDVDVPGGNLRESLMPLPYKEPSGTLFQLLGFVVTAAEKFIGTQELGIADGNKETPVGTTVALLERGSKVMSAVHKRLHAALKLELKLLADLFAQETPLQYPYEVDGGGPEIMADDFSPAIDIVPVSDPNIFSMAQRVVLAQEQLKLAQSAPELHNLHEAYSRMYSALGVTNIDDLLPPPAQPMPLDPANENAKFTLAAAGSGEPPKAFPGQNHDAHMAAHLAFCNSKMAKASTAVYAVAMQHIYDHIALKSEEMARQELGMPPMQPPSNEQPVDPTSADPNLQARVAEMVATFMLQLNEQEQAMGGGDEDPLVALKSRELDIREAANQQKNQLDAAKMRQNANLAEDKIESAEDIAKMRASIQLMSQANRSNQPNRRQ